MAAAFFIFEWFFVPIYIKKRGEIFAQIVIEKVKWTLCF